MQSQPTPAMIEAGLLAHRDHLASAITANALRAIWHAMERTRLVEVDRADRADRADAMSRRAAANTPWDRPARPVARITHVAGVALPPEASQS